MPVFMNYNEAFDFAKVKGHRSKCGRAYDRTLRANLLANGDVQLWAWQCVHLATYLPNNMLQIEPSAMRAGAQVRNRYLWFSLVTERGRTMFVGYDRDLKNRRMLFKRDKPILINLATNSVVGEPVLEPLQKDGEKSLTWMREWRKFHRTFNVMSKLGVFASYGPDGGYMSMAQRTKALEYLNEESMRADLPNNRGDTPADQFVRLVRAEDFTGVYFWLHRDVGYIWKNPWKNLQAQYKAKRTAILVAAGARYDVK